MIETLLVLTLLAAAGVVALLVLLLARLRAADAMATSRAELHHAALLDGQRAASDALRGELQRIEQSARADAAAQRQELQAQLAQQRSDLAQQRTDLAQQRRELDERIAQFEARLAEQVGRLTTATAQASAAQASELGRVQTLLGEELTRTRTEIAGAVGTLQRENLAILGSIGERVATQLAHQTRESGESIERLRTTVEVKLASIQAAADAKLEEMRVTVDEKLSNTLTARLGESFRLVSDRLEAVQSGFGEMRSLAGNVTDLRRIMTNVKTRGVWGEVQLANLLGQLFTEAQYERNYRPRPRSQESVEFALRLPGPDADSGPVYLPVDSKFPIEDYQRLVEASEAGDVEGVRAATRALEVRIEGCARDIRDKYVHPPATTNFAVLFLPTEALYAEVAKMPGLIERLQRDCRVTVTGPTTFSAFAMSLLMGFSTLAIQRRSADIAKLLGAVKTDFGKFGELLVKVESKLDDAKDSIEKARGRSDQIVRKLARVDELPADEARLLLPEPGADPDSPALPA